MNEKNYYKTLIYKDLIYTNKNNTLIIAMSIFLLMMSCVSSSPEIPEEELPNILWISIEDLSPIIGAYGDEQAHTPNIDQLAAEGVLYHQAYVPSPICSPTRSSLITGINATSLGTQQLRSDIPLPDYIKTLPQYLADAGYYTTNNSKTDYNFDPSGRWDENSAQAHWRNRPEGKPFFSVINFMTTHEGRANTLSEEEKNELIKGLDYRHDPGQAKLPPYFPETPEMRAIWAHYYDLTTLVDQQIGEVLAQLEEDGLTENTIVIFFSDHGSGLPRYKRWPYRTGLQVPMVIRVPAKFRHMIDEAPGTETDRLVNLLDLAPSMLRLAKAEVPNTMQGIAFLGENRPAPRQHMVAFRSRADDVYEVSRTVIDGRYLYLRNYMPHQPWIQQSVIFSDEKDSYRVLHRAREEGILPEAGLEMFASKPLEELYDLQEDPYELNNLAQDQKYIQTTEKMRTLLREWILSTRDTDFLHESEMMLRSQGSTPYQMAHDTAQYNLPQILKAAEKVGDKKISSAELRQGLQDDDSGVRYWSALALQAKAVGQSRQVNLQDIAALRARLQDNSPAVQIAAAEGLCQMGACSEQALSVLSMHLQDEQRPWLALHAAASLRRMGEQAKPLASVLKNVRQKHSGDKGTGGYDNWLFSMFIGFAVDQALENIGQPWEVTRAENVNR
ncbi:sulfatase-like hydrolase/transferase [soil metagenome]